MRLTVPAPDITLYETGFSGVDLLERAATGQRLSKLVDAIEEPLVIALDGRWGTGKSVFLRCWVGAHRLENDGRARTVYFDAFQNDYLDDPLVGLVSTLAERFPDDDKTISGVERIKSAAAKLARPALRIALAAATYGASELASGAIDAVIEQGSEEAEAGINQLWEDDASRKKAYSDFRQALSDLTIDASGDVIPLVIAVDELDRCRPDYAISLLETVKHFFDVPHVHFVLGVNLDELSNSVRQRYGADTNARLYLQKFISLTLRLKFELYQENRTKGTYLRYLNHIGATMKIVPQMIAETEQYLKIESIASDLSLRAVNRIGTEMVLAQSVPGGFDHKGDITQTLIAGLIVMKVVQPEAYKRVLTQKFTQSDVSKFLGPKIGRADPWTEAELATDDCMLQMLWQLPFDGGALCRTYGYSIQGKWTPTSLTKFAVENLEIFDVG